MEFKYEIGTQFKTRGSALGIVDPEVVIEARKVSELGEFQYWISNSSGDCSTYFERTLDKWTVVKPFFQKGDTFEHRGERGTVLFVTEDNAAAMVKLIDPVNGNVSYEAVTDWTYQRVTNIQHHEV
jgi:hypothetical protein